MNPVCFFMMLRAGAILLLVLAAAGQAAVLTYPMGYSQDDDNPDFPAGTSGASVISTYGDNITQADIDAGYYGAAGGPTPNVLVWNDYENIYVKVCNDGYGDLPSVLCSPYNWYMLEFKTDDNHLVDLHDFDMATRADEGVQITVDLLIDGQLVKRLSPYVFGKAMVGGPGRVHFDTSDAQGESGTYGFGVISGRHLGIRIWPNPLGEDVGITNIHFSQREDFQAFAPVPLPETTGVSLDTASLAWTSHDDVAYDVWFGTTADLAGVTPVRTAEAALDLAETALPFGSLDPNVTYFWRVDTVQASGAVTNGPLWSFTTAPGQAYAPIPLSGSINQGALSGQLSWTGPQGAEFVQARYRLFLGRDAASLDPIGPAEGLGECVWSLSAALEASATYYWRVDTVIHGQTFTGLVWSFDTAPLKASWPLPAHEGAGLPSSNLRWVPGATALSHRVYLGTEASLSDGDLQDVVDVAAFMPIEPLQAGQTYYWRVDEVVAVNGGESVVRGDLWQFTVEDLPVDGLIVALTPETMLTNGQCIENWRDLSGRNNDAMMYDQESRPWQVQGESTTHVVVDFDGVDDHLVIGANPEDFDRNTFTWYVVGVPLHPTDTMAMISSGYEGGSCWGWMSRLWGTAWEDSTWITWAKSPGHNSVVSNGTSSELAIVSGVWDGNHLWQYVNSLSAGTVAAGADGNPTSHQFTLLGSGFAQPGKGNYLNGQIAEVLVYNRTLRPEEKAAVDSYLAAKYGFVPEIPTNPSPPDRSKHVDLEIALAWDGPTGATYDVFFQEAGAAGWTQVAAGISETHVALSELADPIVLDYDGQYRWRVDMWRNGSRVKGPEWSFETWVPYCSAPIPGDLNGDCVVDVQDLLLMLENWLQSN